MKSEAPATAFDLVTPVEPADIDTNGHVNNVVYLRWVQNAAVAHWLALVKAHGWEIVADQFAWVVRKHEIEYLRPAFAGERLLSRTWLGDARAATFERHTRILRHPSEDNGLREPEVLAKARSLWVVLDAASGRPRRIDPRLRAMLQPAAADAADDR